LKNVLLMGPGATRSMIRIHATALSCALSIHKKERRSFANKSGTSMVGILWLKGDLLILDASPLNEPELYGDCLGHRASHICYWKAQQDLGIAAREIEYEEFPRSQVVVNNRTQRFVLYAIAAFLKRKAVVKRILDANFFRQYYHRHRRPLLYGKKHSDNLGYAIDQARNLKGARTRQGFLSSRIAQREHPAFILSHPPPRSCRCEIQRTAMEMEFSIYRCG
jgi:hypothetical protein